MQQSRFLVVDHLSLTPNRCVVYPRFYKREKIENLGPARHEITLQSLHPLEQLRQLDLFIQDYYFEKPAVEKKLAAEKKITPIFNFHNFELSKTAQKNLKNKVTWLYHFARKKNVVTKKGKQLSNFRMNFATLKLPSIQQHTSDFITKNCLNQLFVEIAKKHDFKNYVWRLEYQKNGNLHYHIATDTYIDFFWLQFTWNRILNKYGYVDAYTRKFAQMDFATYRKMFSKNDNTNFEVLQERYAKGCREKWTQPNSVDVKAVFGQNNIAFYISKYMSKSKEDKEQIMLPVCEDNSKNSRLWFCSRSLSACKTLNDIREAMDIDIFGILSKCEGIVKHYHDYCIVIYFDFSKLPALTKAVIRKCLELYRQSVLYVPV